MEVGCDGPLYSLIEQNKNLTEMATSFIAKSLLEAVQCMHNSKILHRDIKPENIVLIMVLICVKYRAMLRCVILAGQSTRSRSRN